MSFLPKAPSNQSGFTTIELVVTIIVIGIMAAVALPKLGNLSDFGERGFRDQAVATLRFAQKTAIAQNGDVSVSVSPTGVTLGGSNSCLPFKPKSGTGLSSASFKFLSSGGTDQSSDIVLTVTGESNITIDAVTGFVR